MRKLGRESRDYVQTVIDAIPEITMVIGRDYRVVLANRAARKLVGGEDPVSSGLTCHQLSHHSDVPCQGLGESCPLIQVVRTGRPVTVTHTHYDRDDNEVLVEVSASPVFDEAGEVVEVIEACRNGTAQPAGNSGTAGRKHASVGAFQAIIEGAERALLDNALRALGGNKTAAAAALGMKPSTFRDKLAKHGLP